MKFLEDNNTLLLWMTITIIPLLTGNGAFGGEAREIEGERKKKGGYNQTHQSLAAERKVSLEVTLMSLTTSP